jgi:AcrR family transcriptional regulator
MRRTRLTREESRDQTHQRLLDAAQTVIARKGLAAASVEDIAAQAGYTRGAFYSNFGGKGELFIELLRRDHLRAEEEMAAILGADLAVEEIEARVRQMYGQLHQDAECFMNWTEARMLAARDAKFRVRLNALMTEKVERIAAFITGFYARRGTPPVAPPLQMAMGLMGLVEGLRLFRLSSPQEMTPAVSESILTLFLDSLLHYSGSAGPRPAQK